MENILLISEMDQSFFHLSSLHWRQLVVHWIMRQGHWEQEAHPTLDKLTSKISTLNLERVRQIKSRLVAITGRVQKVRDELEHLKDDDEDMAEMYLTDKLEQQLDNSSPSSSFVNDEDEELLQTENDDRFICF